LSKRKTILSLKFLLTVCIQLALLPSVLAQAISIDRGISAEGLWCFPLTTDSTTWLYLPDNGQLAIGENKKPQFSFIRYVNETEDKTDGSESTITKAGGGGILHFLVTYDTDERKIAKAEAKLNELFSGQRIKIRGPIIFKEGRYALVSKIINPDNGQQEKKLLSVGAAPVLQGSRIALSFEMDPVRSKLLLESLKMPTPDVSIVFDMTFAGLMDAYKAKLTVDWTEVHKINKTGGGLKIYYISTDIEKEYEMLRRTGAIKLEVEGEDVNMEKIVDGAYVKLLEMMYQKIEPEQLPKEDQGAAGDLLTNLLNDKATFSGSGYSPFGAHFTYKRKSTQTSGSSILHFNSRNSTERHHYITFNIGNFYTKYGEGDEYIRTVSLFDGETQVRHIAVGVDGDLLPELARLINNVTVKLRKNHQNGTVTMKEVNINPQIINNDNKIELNYGAVGDTDRIAWFDYYYNAQFSFRGGKSWETGWQLNNTSMINLLTPYERKKIELEGNADTLLAKNVRAVTVKVEYPFFDGIKTVEEIVRPALDKGIKSFEITLPAGKHTYKYTIRWTLNNGTIKTASGETDMGILFIDGVPKN